jgi:hypothetical protein
MTADDKRVPLGTAAGRHRRRNVTATKVTAPEGDGDHDDGGNHDEARTPGLQASCYQRWRRAHAATAPATSTTASSTMKSPILTAPG